MNHQKRHPQKGDYSQLILDVISTWTDTSYEDRRLGESVRIKVSTRTLIMATGNNLSFVGDLARRILPITLDHRKERPETLSFPFDPVARVSPSLTHPLHVAVITAPS